MTTYDDLPRPLAATRPTSPSRPWAARRAGPATMKTNRSVRSRGTLSPLTVSSTIFLHPVRFRASRCKSIFCSVVVTRAYPIRGFPPPPSLRK